MLTQTLSKSLAALLVYFISVQSNLISIGFISKGAVFVGPICIFLGAYGKDVTQRIDSFIKNNVNVENKRILVIGSITPWLELIMLKQGAANVTMLDYHDYKVYR